MDRLIVGIVALVLTVSVGSPELAGDWASIGIILDGGSVFETSSPLFTYLVAQLANFLGISLLSAAFYGNAVCFAVAVSLMHCWAINQTADRWSAFQLTALMAITPVMCLGSIAVPGHGLALACTALAFWLVSRGGPELSLHRSAMAGVAMTVGVLAHETAIFAPIGVLGWMLTRGRVPGFGAIVAMFALPAAYMVLGSNWAAEQSLAAGDVDVLGSIHTEWLRPFMPLSLVLIYLALRRGSDQKRQRLASVAVLAMVSCLAVITTGVGGSGMGLAILLWPTAHIAFTGLTATGRISVVLAGALVASLAVSTRLPDPDQRSYSDAIQQHLGDGALTILSLGQPESELRVRAERGQVTIFSLDSLLGSGLDRINARVAEFDADVRRRFARGEHIILGVATAEKLLLASSSESMGAGFVEYITKNFVVHFTVVDGYKLVELTDGSVEASGDTHVLTLEPPAPPPSTP